MSINARLGDRLRAARARRSTQRGVSPIIATILLVAITVVLAAVLYVLISGLTGSTAAAPIALAPSVGSTGGGGTTWYVGVTLTPSASVATTQFGLKVTNSTSTFTVGAASAGCTVGASYVAGTTCKGTAGVWYAVLTNASGKIAALYTTGGTWSSSVTITGGSFVVNVISATQLDGQGYKLTASGTGSASISGQVQL